MGIREWINRNINDRLPGNRSDNQILLYNEISQQYGWASQQSDKPLGDYDIYYKAGKNVFVNAAINAYYNQLLSNGFTIKNINSEIIDIPRTNYLTGLFNAPEGLKSNIRYSQFLRQIVHSYLLTGDAFIEISYDHILDKDIVNGFKYIAPELLTWYRDTEQFGFINNSSLRYEPDELIHIYDIPASKDNIYGESRIDTIGLALSLLFESLKYNKDFFKNKGLDPNAILSFDKDMDDTAFLNEVGRLSVQAKKNNGRGMLAVKGGNVSSVNRNLRDGDYTNLLILCRNIILNGYNCPPSLAGIVETSNLSANTIDSEMRLFKSPVNSVAETIEGAFNNVLQRNGFQESFTFNPIDLTDQLEETQIRIMELDSGLKTINEVRVEMGLDTVAWGDKPLGLTQVNESNVDIDTGDEDVDKALSLINSTREQFYRSYPMDWNNFILQLDYRTPFNKEEQELYESICQGLDRQLSATIEWLKSDEAKQFYRERAEYLDWLWENEIDLENQLDHLINYNSSASTDEFMSRFYHIGCAMGAEQLKRELAYTPADEQTLNFIRQTNYGYIKNLNKDMEISIRKTIFEDVAQGKSYQETIKKLRKLPLTPVANGRISPDVRARMIARTERARARSYGSLQSYANYGVSYYDLITRGKKACNICKDYEARNPWPITDPTAYVPLHPNCICSNGPHIPEGETVSSTPVDFPISISDYVDLTMTPPSQRI